MKQHVVDNLRIFTNGMRAMAFSSLATKSIETGTSDLDELSSDERKDLNYLLPYKFSLDIVKEKIIKQKNKYTGEVRYLVGYNEYNSILEELQKEIVSVVMQEKLEKHNNLLLAYDDEQDAFVFWEEDEEEPKTD